MFMKLNFWTKVAQKFDITPANDRENEKIRRLQKSRLLTTAIIVA